MLKRLFSCLLAAVLLVVCALPLAGCSVRKTATVEDIERICGELGLTISEKAATTKTIDVHYIIVDPNCEDFQMEYYVYTTNAKAQSQYLQKKTTYEYTKGEKTEFQSSAFSKFTMSYSDTFNLAICQYNVFFFGTDLTTNGKLQAFIDALKL